MARIRPRRCRHIILVYVGDGGLGAMLLDVVKKTVGREDCPLCEITYGPLVTSRFVVSGTSYGRRVRFNGITISRFEDGVGAA